MTHVSTSVNSRVIPRRSRKYVHDLLWYFSISSYVTQRSSQAMWQNKSVHNLACLHLTVNMLTVSKERTKVGYELAKVKGNLLYVDSNDPVEGVSECNMTTDRE